MAGGLSFPNAPRFRLLRAGVPSSRGVEAIDIEIADGLIAALAPPGAGAEGPAGIDLAGRMVLPCPVDLHTHLDKGHIWPRAANPDGTFAGAIATAEADRVARWSARDVALRMEFGLRCAYAHGTRAIRTHLDSQPPQDAITWPVLDELRARWAGRIDLQAVALCPLELYSGADGAALAARMASYGGILGAFAQGGPELAPAFDRLLALAAHHGLDVDCHLDETLDPGSTALRSLAEAALRRPFAGRIVAGHCCSLATQPPDEVAATLDRVAQSGIAIVSLPMCNLYLQDRQGGRTPRQRGLTLVHEIRARGIPLAFASDNTRDPFYPYGDLDMIEVFREAVRLGHLDHPIDDWPAAISAVPARVMGGPQEIAVGAPADLVILEGRHWSEVLARPQSRRTVLRRGRPLDLEPPPYAELDPLLTKDRETWPTAKPSSRSSAGSRSRPSRSG